MFDTETQFREFTNATDELSRSSLSPRPILVNQTVVVEVRWPDVLDVFYTDVLLEKQPNIVAQRRIGQNSVTLLPDGVTVN